MTTGMEYFLVLAEEQSISRAAQRLFVTQQSMSEQMKRLEQIYGAKLFIRRPRFQLTAAGEALLSAARQIRILEQGLTVQLHNIQEKGGGQLRIGIHATRARMFLPQAVEQFYRVFPNVELIFFHDDTRDFEQMLLNGDLDLFFGVDAAPFPEFETISLAEEPIYLIASKSLLERQLGWDLTLPRNTILPQELEQLPLIFSHDRSNLQQKVDHFFQENSIIPRKILTISDFEAQLMLACRDIGACFCPKLMLQKVQELNNQNPCNPLHVFPVKGLIWTSQLSLVLHRKAYHSPALLTLIRLLRESFLTRFSALV